ncbi:MAG: nucleotidyltransferase domain-containing protein [Candidatus Promineifilaceae bacterium]
MPHSFVETAVTLANQIADQYAALPQVEAVALGGSLATQQASAGSDIDLYVYSHQELAVAARTTIAQNGASHSEVNNQFWEPGDEWIDATTGIHVDVMFRSTNWIESQLEHILVKHQASVGYSTCFWHNVLTSTPLFDRTNWYDNVKKMAQRPYPPQLQQNIIAKNFPILRNTLSSYLYQINSAVRRADTVSLNHRVAALLASYFDILFALNELPHPGEKRLLHLAITQCLLLPDNMREQVNNLLTASTENAYDRTNALVDGLKKLLDEQGA